MKIYNVSHKNLMVDIGINLYKWILTVGKCHLAMLDIHLGVMTQCGGALLLSGGWRLGTVPHTGEYPPPKSGVPRWLKHDLHNPNVALVLIS